MESNVVDIISGVSLKDIDGGDGERRGDAEGLERGEGGHGARGEGAHVRQRRHRHRRTGAPHRQTEGLRGAAPPPLLLRDVLEAPHDDEHVVDADRQAGRQFNSTMMASSVA